jgi:hypothetical protein
MDPEGFLDEVVVREARMQNPTEFVNSSYFFAQPLTGERRQIGSRRSSTQNVRLGRRRSPRVFGQREGG